MFNSHIKSIQNDVESRSYENFPPSLLVAELVSSYLPWQLLPIVLESLDFLSHQFSFTILFPILFLKKISALSKCETMLKECSGHMMVFTCPFLLGVLCKLSLFHP